MMNLATDFLPTCRASTVANYARLATQFLSASTRLCSPACPALPCPLTVTSAPSRPASFLTYVAATLNQSLGRVVKKQGRGGEGEGSALRRQERGEVWRLDWDWTEVREWYFSCIFKDHIHCDRGRGVCPPMKCRVRNVDEQWWLSK